MIIFKTSMKRILKNKIKFAILLIVPVIFIAMYALQDLEPSLTIGIVDKDKSSLSKKINESIKQMDKVKVLEVDEKSVYDSTVSRQMDYTIIVEEDFEKNLIAGRDIEINEFYIDGKEKIFYAQMFIENYIYNMKILARISDFDRVKFNTLLKKYDKNNLNVVHKSDNNQETSQSILAIAFLIQYMLYMSK